MAEEKIEMKSLEDNLREAFELFDTDKDGEITLAELQKIMNMHGRAVNGTWRNLNVPVSTDLCYKPNRLSVMIFTENCCPFQHNVLIDS